MSLSPPPISPVLDHRYQLRRSMCDGSVSIHLYPRLPCHAAVSISFFGAFFDLLATQQLRSSRLTWLVLAFFVVVSTATARIVDFGLALKIGWPVGPDLIFSCLRLWVSERVQTECFGGWVAYNPYVQGCFLAATEPANVDSVNHLVYLNNLSELHTAMQISSPSMAYASLDGIHWSPLQLGQFWLDPSCAELS